MRQFFRGQELPVAGCSDVKVYDNPEEYLNLSDEEKYAIDKIVVLEDDEALPLTADNIPYDLENGESVKDAIEKFPKIQVGKFTATLSNVTSGALTSVTFSKPFKHTPKVIIQQAIPAFFSNNVLLVTLAGDANDNLNENGFRASGYWGAGNGSCACYYIAIDDQL